jgi:hypothetical protein
MASSLEEQFAEILKEYDQELKEDIEKALTKASRIMVRSLAAASPMGDDSPHFRNQWGLKTKYTGVRYIGNSKSVPSKNGDIPLINLLEYGPYAKPFVARTFEANKETVFNTFVQTLKGGK